MKEERNLLDKVNHWANTSISLRLAIITTLVLLLLIPISFVEELIRERSIRQDEAVNEVSSIWGNSQRIAGPVLTVPYIVDKKIQFGENLRQVEIKKEKNLAHFLPELVEIGGEASPIEKKRGLFKVIVYQSRMSMKGHFLKPDFSLWGVDESNILWDEAYIDLGVSDLRGIRNQVELDWEDSKHTFNPGSNDFPALGNNIKVGLKVDPELDQHSYDINLEVNGSQFLSFVPLGKTTKLNLSSDWPHPKFSGAFLPDTHRITDEGFQAEWQVLHLNRPIPQQFLPSSKIRLDQFAFGLELINPVNEYKKSERSVKYAMLFIVLTFVAFFFIQILNGVRIHPLQYILVGLALSVFYTLLISVSEHLGFDTAYWISAGSTILLISTYCMSIFKSNKFALALFSLLTLLYVFIYFVIDSQDHALLMGSIGLFVILALVMYLSRNVNWFTAGKTIIHKTE